MKNVYIEIFFLIIICFISNLGMAQDFNTSNYIAGSGNIRINETKKITDGFVLFGDFLGTISRPENIVPDGRDIILAKYDDNFDLMWIKHIGGTLIDLAKDIVVDSDNNLYVLGAFQGTCFFDGLGGLTSDGGYDVFLAKYSSSGNFLWSKKIAYSTDNQNASSIDIDDTNLIVSGFYAGSIDFDSQSFSSAYGMYYAKLDTSGTFIWAENIPTTSSSSTLESVSVFSDGYYFNGQFKGTATFDSLSVPKVYISNNGSYTDAFLCKTDTAGTFQWLRRTYGDGNAFTGTMAQDIYGSVYYTGLFNGTNMTVDSTYSRKGSRTLINKGSSDIFILKYNKNGNLNWNSAYGRDGSEWARDIKWKNDALYLTGYFSDTIVFGNDTLFSSSLTDQDAFIGIFDNYGNKLRASKIDDSNDNNESGLTISIDTDNSIYWGGSFKSNSVVVGDSTFLNPNLGKQCIYFTKGSTPLSVAITSTKNSTCNLSNDGELVVTPYFGVYPFTYEWSHDGGLNDSTVTGLSPGTYGVTVTGAMGSSDITEYTLTEPGAFIFNPSLTQVSTCSDSEEGAIDVNLTGGNGGNTYLWNGEGTENVEDQTTLTVGTYNVTVTDSEGCTGDTTINITGPDPVIFGSSVITHYTGPTDNGEIDLTPLGGTGDPATYVAVWTGPPGYTQTGQDIADAAAGSFDVTVTDANACVFDTSLVIQNQAVFSTFISSQKDACKNGSNGEVTIGFFSPDGHTNISYLWDANAGDQTTAKATGLVPGIYSVTVTDNEPGPGTIDSVRTVTIGELAYVLTADTISTNHIDCKGGNDGSIDLSITVAGVLPYSYSWDGPSAYTASTQDISGLYAGAYSATVRDANGCEFNTIAYTLDEPALDLTAIASIESEPLCNGSFNGEVRVDASGGNTGSYNYKWNDPGSQTSQIADGLDAGSYKVTVTDGKGCNTTSTVNLTEPVALALGGSMTDLTCFNVPIGAIDVTSSGGTVATVYSYNWSSIDGSGHVVTDEDQIGLGAGTYNLTVTDDNLCTISDNFLITEPAEIIITDTTNIDITTCNGDNNGTIEITTTGGTGVLTYTLNPGATQMNTTGIFSSLTGGVYTVDVTDESACGPTTSDPIRISEPTTISIDTESKTDVTDCNGNDTGTITIAASGGTGALTYTLNPGAIQTNTTGLFTALLAGTYTVSVDDVNNCGSVTSGSLIISEPSVISVTSATVTSPIACNGGTATVTIVANGGTAPLSYTFDGVANTNGIFTGVSAGSGLAYSVSDANTCTAATGTLDVTEPSVISVTSATVTSPIACNGGTATVRIVANGGTAPLSYTFDGVANTNGIFTGVSAGSGLAYSVSDANVCTAATGTLDITEPTVISVTSATVTSPIACNGGTATVTIVASGGTAPLSYTFDGVTNTDGIFTGVSAGTALAYSVTDANICTAATGTLDVTEPTVISVTSAMVTSPIACNGGTATVTIVASGGTAPLSYTFDGVTNTTGVFTGVSAGSGLAYSVSDANACNAATGTLDVTEPTAISVTSATITSPIACNGGTATVTIVASGGTAPLSYTFDGVTNTTGVFTGVSAGTNLAYSVTDANTCTAATGTISVTEPAAISISSATVTTPITCNGGTATVTIVATGGTLPHSYTFNGETNTNGIFTGVSAGNNLAYSVTDANTCTAATGIVSVTEPAAISISSATVTTPITCNGGTAAVTIVATGGTLPHSYTFNGETNTNGIFTGVFAGNNLSYSVTDANTCTAVTGTLNVTEPTALAVLSANVTSPITCNGGTGIVTIVATGGTSPYSYTFDGVTSSNGVFTGVSAGDNLSYSVTDANTCTAVTGILNVTEPTALAVSSANVTSPITCNGGTGIVTIVATGGTSPYSYTFDGVTNSNGVFTGVFAGNNLSYSVTDANTCTAVTGTLNVPEPTALSVSSANVTSPITCNGGTGIVTIVATGGTSPYSYTFDGVTNSNGVFTGVSAGNNLAYSVTDANTCTAVTGTLNVTEPTALTVSSANVTSPITCNGGTGTVTIVATGGTSPYSYTFDGVTNSNGVFTGVFAGNNLSYSVTDANTCTAVTGTLNVTEPTALAVSSANITSPITCNGGTGTVTIVATGGTSPYSYTFDGVTNSNGVFTGVFAGNNLSYSVTDANTCTAVTGILNVTEPTALAVSSANVTSPITCNGGTGTVTIVATGGTSPYSYTFDGVTNSNGVFTGVFAGNNLSYSVTDANTCTAVTGTLNVTEPTALAVSSANVTSPITCNGGTGTVTIVATGGTSPYSYTFDGVTNSNGVFTGVSAGDNLSYSVTDANTCTAVTGTLNVTEPTALTVSSANITSPITCNGGTGTVTIVATGGTSPYSYTFDGVTNSNGVFTGVSAGDNLSYSVTDANTCTAVTGTLNVTEPTALTVSSANITSPITCNGGTGTVTIVATGGTSPYSYTFDGVTNSNGVFTGVFAGNNLSYSVADANTCTAVTGTLNVTEPTALAVSSANITSPITCNGGTGIVTIVATGGTSPYSYTFDGVTNSNGVFTGVSAGSNLSYSVSDANSCTAAIGTLDVNDFEAIATETFITDVSCNGLTDGSIDITISGGSVADAYTYNWSSTAGEGYVVTDEDQSGLGAGTYDLTVTDDNLCTSIASITINEPEAINIAETDVTDVSCHGLLEGSIDITVSGGTASIDYTYTWTSTDGNGLIAGQDQPTLGAGTYYLTVSDDNSCEATASFSLTEPDTIIITETVNAITCGKLTDGIIDISHTGGTLPFTYLWTTDDGSGLDPASRDQNGLSIGTYYLKITDALGCIVEDSAEMVSPPEISIDLENSMDASSQDIADGSVSVEASGGTGVLTYTLLPNNSSNETGVFEALFPGDYTVQVEDENFCGPVASDTITVGSLNAVEGLFGNDFVKIYPNPASDKLYLEFENTTDLVNVQLISISGDIMFTKEIKTSGFRKQELDLTNYSQGIYFIRVFNAKFNINSKILIQ